MDYTFYRTLFRKTVSTSLVEHVTLPSLNLFDPDFVRSSDFQISVPIQERLGYVLHHYNVLLAGQELEDVSEKLIKEKMAWLKKLKRLQPTDLKKSLRELKRFKANKETKLSVRLRRYVNHVERDPIVGFDATANWLYSGGTVVPHSQRDEDLLTLVAASGDDMSSISKVVVNDDGTLNFDVSTKLKIPSPILQIATDPVTSLIGVRQMHNFTILKHNYDDFSVVRKKKIHNPNYFTSAALSGGRAALTKNVGDAVVLDVETNQVNFKKSLWDLQCSMKNNWSQVHWKDDQLMCLIRKKLGIIDPRGAEHDWDLTDVFDDCETICNYFESERSSYLASTHHLYEMDIRNHKFVRRWTHLLRSPPHLGQAIKVGEDDLVILQSYSPTDSVVLNNSLSAMHIPPRGLLSPIDSLRDVQMEGHCLDPQVSRRTAYTIVGTQLCQDKDKIRQFTQNAGGDIFVRSITKEDDETTMDVDENVINIESWKNYENTAPLPIKSSCTQIVDMTSAFDMLRIPEECPTPLVESVGVTWDEGSKVVPKKLHKYQDVMCEPILEVWNVQPDVSDDDDDGGRARDDVDIHDKVEEWLLKHATQSDEVEDIIDVR